MIVLSMMPVKQLKRTVTRIQPSNRKSGCDP